jgi:hypothetical protein
MRSKTRRLGLIACALITAAVSTAVVVTRVSQPPPSSASRPTPSFTQHEASPARTPDVAWDDALGLQLPLSQTAGPRRRHSGIARGFSRTDLGAAFAAANLVPRTSPNVGPAIFGETLDEQVRGPNREAMARQVATDYQTQRRRAGVRDGAQLPSTDAELVGYANPRLSKGGAHATVQLVLTSPDLRATDQLLVMLVSLQWSDGDWQLIAPPQGDWGTVSSVATRPPSGMQTFGGASDRGL